VHRVQRVPATDTGGRTHTSTVAVVVSLFYSVFVHAMHEHHKCLLWSMMDGHRNIETLTATTLQVLPLIEEDPDTAKSDDLFSMSDIKLEVIRARGAGGQHINKTESAVRLTHIPTGITVSMQDERSQHRNRRRAFMVLRARLLERKLGEEERERRAVRRNLVKGADRSEKVRTYNFAQVSQTHPLHHVIWCYRI
jgi:peptide chain release factor 1